MSRILLVEDSPTQAIKFQYILEQEGWQVEGATNPDEALESLNQSIPDLLITDYYQLPQIVRILVTLSEDAWHVPDGYTHRYLLIDIVSGPYRVTAQL